MYILINMSNNIIFKLLKEHKYDELLDIIKSDKNIELDIKDESGTYLIQYIIIYNNKDLLTLLLTRNINLDIFDSEGKTILYYPIKFNYIDIVKILLLFNHVNIGIPLLDMIDNNQNIPLHYAIYYNSFEITKEILKYKFNVNIKDIDGNNSLQIAINKKNIDIINLLLDTDININNENKNGQNSLYQAINNNLDKIVDILLFKKCNINSKDINQQMTPLLLSTFNNNFNIAKHIYVSGGNPNDQDIFGNTILHYAISNNNVDLFNFFFDKVDTTSENLNGRDVIGFLLYSNISVDDYSKYNIDKLLLTCNINNQDINGNTILYRLIELDLFYKYIDILKKKKLNIFIKNHENITPYDILVKKNDKKLTDLFIDVVANAYFDNNFDCSGKNKNDCIHFIKNEIVNKNFSVFINQKKKLQIEINEKNINFITYTGTTLDVVIGMMYLKNKYNNIETSLSKNFVKNEIVENYYKNIGLNKNLKYEFLNFELLWLYQHFFIPTELNSIINNFINNNDYRFFILPLGIELSQGTHANILLYDKQNNTLERFEPYGKDYPPGFNYQPDILDMNIENFFKKYFKKIIYLTPNKYQNKIGPQLIDTLETKNKKFIGDPNGFCASWCVWYIDNRIKYIDLQSNIMLNKLINYIKLKNLQIRQVIRNYSKNITDMRDGYLFKINIDINDWLNDNLTDDAFNDFVKLLSNDI